MERNCIDIPWSRPRDARLPLALFGDARAATSRRGHPKSCASSRDSANRKRKPGPRRSRNKFVVSVDESTAPFRPVQASPRVRGPVRAAVSSPWTNLQLPLFLRNTLLENTFSTSQGFHFRIRIWSSEPKPHLERRYPGWRGRTASPPTKTVFGRLR